MSRKGLSSILDLEGSEVNVAVSMKSSAYSTVSSSRSARVPSATETMLHSHRTADARWPCRKIGRCRRCRDPCQWSVRRTNIPSQPRDARRILLLLSSGSSVGLDSFENSDERVYLSRKHRYFLLRCRLLSLSTLRIIGTGSFVYGGACRAGRLPAIALQRSVSYVP